MLDVLYEDNKAMVLTIGVGDDKVDVILSGAAPVNLIDRLRKQFEKQGGTAHDMAMWIQGCNWGLVTKKMSVSLGV